MNVKHENILAHYGPPRKQKLRFTQIMLIAGCVWTSFVASFILTMPMSIGIGRGYQELGWGILNYAHSVSGHGPHAGTEIHWGSAVATLILLLAVWVGCVIVVRRD